MNSVSLLYFLVIFVLHSSFEEGLFDGRIVGGYNISIEQVPYQVSLQYKGSHFCGASIISHYHIITAGHCIFEESVVIWSVRAGTSVMYEGGQVIPVRKITIHPKYTVRTDGYDIAVLELTNNLTFGSTVLPITLPEINQTWPAGTEVLVSGWGTISEEMNAIYPILQGVTIELVDKRACNETYDGQITDNMLCAGFYDGGKGVCQDDGGPLVINNTLGGIISWGNGCGHAEYPDVYTRVSAHRSFIKKVTGM